MIEIVYNDESFKSFLPIFATKEFLKTKSNHYGWIKNNNFILPFYIDKRGMFSKLVFTTQTIKIKNNSIQYENDFLNQAILKIKKMKIDYIAQPLANCLFDTYPKYTKYIRWGSYIVDLTQSEDNILKNMHSKHRNVIKKAIKEGVVIKESDNIDIIFHLLKDTLQRQNRPYVSKEQLIKLKKISKFYIAMKNDAIQGCAILPYNSFGAYYLYGGSITKPFTGSLNYLHYYAMLEFKKMGVRKYDFMGARLNVEKGSKLEGIQRFKSRFGGELKKGYLWKYEINPIKTKTIYFLQKVIFKLKGQDYKGDAIDQELKNAK